MPRSTEEALEYSALVNSARRRGLQYGYNIADLCELFTDWPIARRYAMRHNHAPDATFDTKGHATIGEAWLAIDVYIPRKGDRNYA